MTSLGVLVYQICVTVAVQVSHSSPISSSANHYTVTLMMRVRALSGQAAPELEAVEVAGSGLSGLNYE